MNRFLFGIIFLPITLITTAETRSFQVDDITLYFHLTNLGTEKEPYIFQDHVIFTYRSAESIRGIAVVFAHEHFQHRYAFVRSPKQHDIYYTAIPKKMFPDRQIIYQYVVDGTQIKDPANPLQYNATLSLTHIQGSEHKMADSSESTTPHTRLSIDFGNLSNTRTHTIFDNAYTLHKKSPTYVSIVGSFNGWEIFFNPLEKQGDRYFATDILLAPGVIHYYFFVDGDRILDPNNSRIAFDKVRGHMVSVLQIP